MVCQAMRETITSPEYDRFQVITDHLVDGLVYDPSYLGVDHTDDVVFIKITLNVGRTVERKKALDARIAELLAKKPGLRPEDVFTNLVQCGKEDCPSAMASLHTRRETSDALTSSYPAQGRIVAEPPKCAAQFPGGRAGKHRSRQIRRSTSSLEQTIRLCGWTAVVASSMP
jgi:4-oxalocrotonate tautomerase